MLCFEKNILVTNYLLLLPLIYPALRIPIYESCRSIWVSCWCDHKMSSASMPFVRSLAIPPMFQNFPHPTPQNPSQGSPLTNELMPWPKPPTQRATIVKPSDKKNGHNPQ